ncbi:DUF1800 domain-containing protein [Bordetella petrii]|uniref:DUF1800 domain-containing protein n=1 Tax=Bordetella petrii TaxID=94624 RepID=UPI001E4F51C7|nr:DUF1800 domain-containing protein [Bordetella petrii]MCD0502394.1 DUF1800 domain-containing protein [Bordetella petrii]
MAAQRRLFLSAAWLLLLFHAAVAMAQQPAAGLPLPALVDRLTWGATPDELRRARELGAPGYIEAQLRPAPDAALPVDVQRHIDALSISRQPADDALAEIRRQQMAVRRMPAGPEQAKARREMRKLSTLRVGDTAKRAVWQALYTPNQLQDQMTWFWMNHFNVYAGKVNVGVVLDDYEARAVRPHALGKFRDLLRATMRSPAMLIYLDNQYNRADHINENYARELMELHTLGVHGGYTQEDVQELARVLTGLRANYSTKPPKVAPDLRAQIVQQDGFLFNPAAHDYGSKRVLGTTIQGRGLAEIDQVADLLASHPATARHISTKLAQYFVADQPPPGLVQAMAATFQKTDGDIAAVLRTLFHSDAFAQSLQDGKFKDPVHYAYSALRLASAGQPPIDRADAVGGWLSRMGQPLYRRLTPDGYPLAQSDWSGSGQMTVRFDLARQIAWRPRSFYRGKGQGKAGAGRLPAFADTYQRAGLADRLSPATRQVIAGAESKRDADTYLLASPAFMRR